MTINYEQLGLKCGIEIHAQLEGKKLFCQCPTLIREDPAHFTVTRQLRASAGESGKIDVAALQEMRKNRTFAYHGYQDTTCLVEIDETPPNPISAENFTTALQVAKMLKGKVVDGVQVMRKTVVDGSNTSGFQRTALIARDGVIDSSLGPIGIPTIILEEDSCKILGETPDSVAYSLDRLGIPLMEIGTTPDIKNPEHCKEVAEKIGLLLRSTGKAKRGLGTIRQDVNVSIRGGNRVEIKGAQDLKSVPKLVENEALRQKVLLEIKTELENRKVKHFTSTIENVTEVLKNSGAKIIAKTIESGGVILGVRLTGFARLVGKEIQPNRRLGTEFSERAKVVAGVGGIIHSDENFEKYGISARDVEFVKQSLGCLDNDAFILVCDSKERSQRALTAVIARANEALDGVPCEVRKANPDDTNSYLRPMPGAARMYPETDIAHIRVSRQLLDSITLPELIEDKAKRYVQAGMGKDLAELTARSEKADVVDYFITQFLDLKPAYVAEIIMTAAKTIKRQFAIDINPTEDDFRELFGALAGGQISKENVLEVLKENKPIAEVIHQYHVISDTELRAALKKVVQENPGVPYNALVGKAMAQLRGKAPGEKIIQFLKALAS
jgi:glutamyl-tRNA(Gln) amidotransferase subunit E